MPRRLGLILAVLIATPALAQTAPPPPPALYGPPIAVDQALALIDRGMRQAQAKGLKMAFAVVEPSGELVAFARMGDAPYASTHVAQQKARASARFRLPTSQFEERVQAGRVALLTSDEVIAVGGGLPIVIDGRVAGALGVSGGTAAEDTALATALVERR